MNVLFIKVSSAYFRKKTSPAPIIVENYDLWARIMNVVVSAMRLTFLTKVAIFAPNEANWKDKAFDCNGKNCLRSVNLLLTVFYANVA